MSAAGIILKKALTTAQYFYIALYFYCVLVTLTKLSILFLYLRIFTEPYFRWICYVLVTLTVLFGISSVVVQGLLCRPIQYMWKGWDGSVTASCVNLTAETFAFAAINMVLDVCIFLLPVPSVG
jgi:hypothetical protein